MQSLAILGRVQMLECIHLSTKTTLLNVRFRSNLAMLFASISIRIGLHVSVSCVYRQQTKYISIVMVFLLDMRYLINIKTDSHSSEGIEKHHLRIFFRDRVCILHQFSTLSQQLLKKIYQYLNKSKSELHLKIQFLFFPLS